MKDSGLPAKVGGDLKRIRAGLHSPDSLGRLIVDYALRNAAEAGAAGDDGKSVELPLTVSVGVPAPNAARTRICTTICAYVQGQEIGCVQICVEALE